jgi:hypothetical protein
VHLLLAAAQGSCPLAQPLLQPREESEDEVERLAVRPARVGPEHEIRLHGHRRKQMPLGRNVGDPCTRDAMGGTVRQVFAVEHDSPLHRPEQPGHGAKERCLSGTVRADDGDGLARSDLDVDVLDDPLAEVTGGQSDGLKQRAPGRDTRR